MLKQLLSILILFLSISAFSQEVEQCGHTAYMEYLESINPGIKQNMDATFKQALAQSKIKTKTSQDTIHTIQVVFHIVYNTAQHNLSDDLITSQLRVLNECYTRTNPDTINTRDIFKPVAGDAGIRFVLATRDPSGITTNGIVRVQTALTAFGSSPTSLAMTDRVKQTAYWSEAWDTDKYLNIWVCDLSSRGRDGLLGYAYPPTGVDNWPGTSSFATADKQGVVLHYKIVGENNPSSLATGEKTAVHEVGHYLGLRHIWGDGGCTVDDYMEDTPLASAANQNCYPSINSCYSAQPDDLPDMIENYMDYTPGKCQNMFTQQQVAQMRANLTIFRTTIFSTYIPVPPAVIATLRKLGILNFPPPIKCPFGVFSSTLTNEVFVSLGELPEDDASQYVIKFFTPLGQVVHEATLSNEAYQAVNGMTGLHGAFIYQLTKNGDEIAKGKVVLGF